MAQQFHSQRAPPRSENTVSRSEVFCMSVPSWTVQTAGRWDHPTSITAAHRTNPGRSVQGNAVQHEEEKVLLPAPRQVSLANSLLSGRARRKRPQVVCFHLREVSWGGKCLEAGSQWPLAGVWEEQQRGGSARGYTASFCGDVTVKVDNFLLCWLHNSGSYKNRWIVYNKRVTFMGCGFFLNKPFISKISNSRVILYTLNICTLLYFHCISIRLFKNL